MWLQLVLILIAFVVMEVSEYTGDSSKQRHKYVVFLTVILVLQSGLRHLAVGSDTFSFYQDFLDVQNTPWQSLYQEIYDTIILGEGKDVGYKVVEKIFMTILPSFRLFLFFIAIVFFIPFCKVAENYLFSCKQLFLFFCIYQAIFYDFFSVTGLRQTLATIAILLGVKYINENKLIRFVLVTIIASLIHKSVLLILPFYFFAKIPKSNLVLLVTFFILPYVFVTAQFWAVLLGQISGTERYIAYTIADYDTSGTLNFLLFLMGGCLLILWAKWKNKKKMPDLLVNACALGLIFAPLTWVDPSLMRVGQYFSIFALIAIPLSIDNLGVSKSLQNIIYTGLLFLLIATIIMHNRDYAFFWDYMQLGENYR